MLSYTFYSSRSSLIPLFLLNPPLCILYIRKFCIQMSQYEFSFDLLEQHKHKFYHFYHFFYIYHNTKSFYFHEIWLENVHNIYICDRLISYDYSHLILIDFDSVNFFYHHCRFDHLSSY